MHKVRCLVTCVLLVLIAFNVSCNEAHVNSVQLPKSSRYGESEIQEVGKQLTYSLFHGDHPSNWPGEVNFPKEAYVADLSEVGIVPTLPEFRILTKEHPAKVVPDMIDKLEDCGYTIDVSKNDWGQQGVDWQVTAVGNSQTNYQQIAILAIRYADMNDWTLLILVASHRPAEVL